MLVETIGGKLIDADLCNGVGDVAMATLVEFILTRAFCSCLLLNWPPAQLVTKKVSFEVRNSPSL